MKQLVWIQGRALAARASTSVGRLCSSTPCPAKIQGKIVFQGLILQRGIPIDFSRIKRRSTTRGFIKKMGKNFLAGAVEVGQGAMVLN